MKQVPINAIGTYTTSTNTWDFMEDGETLHLLQVLDIM